jgi:hypothetical protein
VLLSSAMFFHLDVRGTWAEAPASSNCATLVLPGAQHHVVEGACFGGSTDAHGVLATRMRFRSSITIRVDPS